MAELTTAELIEKARVFMKAMTPEQYVAMIDAQKQSWIRAMAPCEHGDHDWETCPECRARATVGRHNIDAGVGE